MPKLGVAPISAAAMVGLQFQGFRVPVGDEAVIGCSWRKGSMGTLGAGLHPPDE